MNSIKNGHIIINHPFLLDHKGKPLYPIGVIFFLPNHPIAVNAPATHFTIKSHFCALVNLARKLSGIAILSSREELEIIQNTADLFVQDRIIIRHNTEIPNLSSEAFLFLRKLGIPEEKIGLTGSTGSPRPEETQENAPSLYQANIPSTKVNIATDLRYEYDFPTGRRTPLHEDCLRIKNMPAEEIRNCLRELLILAKSDQSKTDAQSLAEPAITIVSEMCTLEDLEDMRDDMLREIAEAFAERLTR